MITPASGLPCVPQDGVQTRSDPTRRQVTRRRLQASCTARLGFVEPKPLQKEEQD
jgi:hypothetical protein